MRRLLSVLLGITLIVLLLTSPALPALNTNAALIQSSMRVTGRPTISLATVRRIVAGSPLAPYAGTIYRLGQARGINPAFALAIWAHESSLGRTGASRRNHNPGNLICAAASRSAAPRCAGRWAYYPNFAVAIADWYRYINARYVRRGLTTVDRILAVYAPHFENRTGAYIVQTKRLMTVWSSGSIR